MSTYASYLKPALKRPLLHIVTEAATRRVMLEGRRCVGVAYEHQGRLKEVRAGREVILSAGAVATPQLLELSGIGRPEILQKVRNPVLHAAPAVGENFRDHINARINWARDGREGPYNSRARGIGAVKEAMRYMLTRAAASSAFRRRRSSRS